MRLLLKFAKKYTWPLIITILSMLALVGAQLLIPWLIRNLIDLVTEQTLSAETMTIVRNLTLIALVTFLARGVVQFLRSYEAHIAGWGLSQMHVNSSMNICRSYLFIFMKINKPDS